MKTHDLAQRTCILPNDSACSDYDIMLESTMFFQLHHFSAVQCQVAFANSFCKALMCLGKIYRAWMVEDRAEESLYEA